MPGSRSNRLPACLLPHVPPDPNVPVVFEPAGIRRSAIPFFQAVAPFARYLTVTTPFRFASPVIAHSIAMPWLVGYGVVTAPGVVAFCAKARPDGNARTETNAAAAKQTRRVI